MNFRPDQLRPTRTRPHGDAAARAALLPRRATGARGFSLVEAMVSAGIVGVMLVASVNLLSSAARTRAADNNRRTALFLAQQLMAEVQQQPYKDDSPLNLVFGPELGESLRTSFDDVDDYNNYREKPPLDRNGAAMPDFSRWQRQVKVKWVDPDTLGSAGTDTGLVSIEVRVTDPRGIDTSVWALRSERAVPADPPLAGSTWVQISDVELQVSGNTPRHVVTGVNTVARPTTK